MPIDSDIEFLQRCYGITGTEAKNILKIRNLKDAMHNLEQRGFQANEEVIQEYKKTRRVDSSAKKDEVYVGSGQVVAKPNRECNLVFYTDGISLNGNFTEYGEDELERLQKMVRNGEFDANLLSGDDNEYRDFHIEYKDTPYKRNENRTITNSFVNMPRAGRRRIPRYLSLDRSDSSIPLDVVFSSESRIVHISNENTVGELLELAKRYSTDEIHFISDGKKIGNDKKLVKYLGKTNKIE